MKLLAIVIAFAISHFVKKPESYKPLSWLPCWEQFFVERSPFQSKELNALLVLFLPIILVLIVIELIFDSGFGYFICSVAVLFYCIGPKDLQEDIESGHFKSMFKIKDSNDSQLITEKMTKVARQRWFGVFFWYVILNVPGALLYRFAERFCHTSNPTDSQVIYIRLMNILNYPVSWMMVLALAIVSDFDQIWNKSRSYFKTESMNELNDRFIFDSMNFAVNNCETLDTEDASAEQLTFNTLKRMLVVWLVIISVLVIFDIF